MWTERLEEIHGIDDLICKTEIEMFSDVENKRMDTEGGEGKARSVGVDKCIPLASVNELLHSSLLWSWGNLRSSVVT